MEVVASIVGSAVIEAGRLLYDSIYSTIRNTAKFQSNLDALETKMKNLRDIVSDVERKLESAEKNEKSPTTRVKEWLKDVEEIELQANLIETGMTSNNKVLCGCLFRCIQRNRISGEAIKMQSQVDVLIEVGSFPDGMVANCLAKTVEHVPGPSIEYQPTASKILANTMKLLKDDGIRRIGIWGMGGVGKTTLVKNLNNKLKNISTQPFEIVIWTTASKVLDIKKIQIQIAERLNLEVRMEETVERTAIRLYQRLEKERNFLLILDDVWETIDLDSLGVPQPEVHKGSKVILTSRFLEVCRNMKTDIDVKVDVLNDEEAWRLFSQNAGQVASLENIKPLAEDVVSECNGLPLAIITMGTSMRGKTMLELWRHALNELRSSVPCDKGIENKVYQPLKWSYDTLEGNNIKPCFLYCALFPEDFSIEVSELASGWLAEGLIDEQKNYEDSVNRALSLIENLKDSCLLEDGAREGTVKMHDVVRDVAIWIASAVEDGCKSLVRSGKGLSEISEAEFLHSVRRVSLMNNNITKLPDCEVQCPEASTLLLQGNLPLESVPETFLQGFQALKILNVSGTRIKSLPFSLLQLFNLRALILRDCFYLEELPQIGVLTRLQVLDLCATRIKELPRGMENLSNLRQVSLSRTHYLKNIQAGIVSRLSGLEVLDMTLSAYHWAVKAHQEEASFEELGCLQRLLVLSIRLESIPCLEDLAWISRLRKFQFFIGSTANSLPSKHDKRRVTISGLDLSGGLIGSLLINASSLILNRCWGLDQMLEDLVINSDNCFAGLKSLTIASSSSSLAPGGGCAAHLDMLPNLEELYLHDLAYIESISELVGHLGLWFSKLKVIEVSRCPRMKHLLYGSFILTLPNLEKIKVSFCDNLNMLFDCWSMENTAPDPPLVPNLRILELKNLPKLRTLRRQGESWPCLEKVDVFKCNRVRKLPLTAQNASTVTEIRGESQWWSTLEWDDDNTRSAMEHFFKPAGAQTAVL